jgi:exosortase A-associated hydrolase 1
MEPDMRRLLTFDCEGAQLGASLDEAEGATGFLMVTGGSQTRIGSHRLYERLAKRLSGNGFPCFRFDRRGVGDSGGDDPGYRGSAADLAAAAARFRAERPNLRHVVGIGLCDGATALALYGEAAGIDGIVMINPWLVEAEADAPPPAAIRRHYREQLLSLSGWKRLLGGSVSYRKLFRGIAKAARPIEGSELAAEVASALRSSREPAVLILAAGDATAIATAREVRARAFDGLIARSEEIGTDSHTFAKPGDLDALLAAILRVVPAKAGTTP